ncbi:MAG: hypothetical protein KKA54_15700 [Proteobacteria bacterium]|nr:hypothetical protein [Pseudomonadota bacterium]MBU0967816.1 hypothetical protein [Pseudomonadota bacterium]
MIRVRIGDSERELPSLSESWIYQQINRRKADGLSICVRVFINDDRLNMSLSSAGCPQDTTGGRPPTRYEKEIFDLWEKRGLNMENFHGGNLVAFLKQLKA